MTNIHYHSILVGSCLLLHSVVDAYPTGAAQCIAGDQAPGGPHTGFGMGTLEGSGMYKFTVDDAYPNDEEAATTLSVEPGLVHTIKLEGLDDATFKGFLVRISHPMEELDFSGTLSTSNNNENIKLMESTGEELIPFPGPGTCATTVAGATHTNNEAKSMIELSFTIPSDFMSTNSDVTNNFVVQIEITAVAQREEYYYSKYEIPIEELPLVVVDPTPPPEVVCLVQTDQTECETVESGCVWCTDSQVCKDTLEDCDGCYTSTKDLLLAQVEDIEAGTTDAYKEYTICDDTIIDVGLPNADFTDFINGDYPLAVARPNAMIKCSGCTLKGGFVQLATLPALELSMLSQPLTEINVDNSTIMGVTFSGDIFQADGQPAGASGFLSAPGAFELKDCTWKDFAGPGVINVGTNVLVPDLPAQTVEVTVHSSTFVDVNYGRSVFHCSSSQSLAVTDNTFSNLSYEFSRCGCQDPAVTDPTADFYFFICREASTCIFDSNCVSDIKFDAAMFNLQDTSTFDLENTNTFVDVVPNNETQVNCNGTDVFFETGSLEGDPSEECLEWAVSDQDFCASDYIGNPCVNLEGEDCSAMEGCLWCEDRELCTSQRGNDQCPDVASTNLTEICLQLDGESRCMSNIECRWCENDSTCLYAQDGGCSDGSLGTRGDPCADVDSEDLCPSECVWCMDKSECQKPSEGACFEVDIANPCSLLDASPECDANNDCQWCASQFRCKDAQETCEAASGEAALDVDNIGAMFAVHDDGLGPTDPEEVTVSFQYLFEVAEDGSTIGPSFIDFASTGFETTQTVGEFFGDQSNVTALRVTFDGSIDGVGTINMDAYIMLTSGTIFNGDGEPTAVVEGDVKFNIGMSGWTFCDANNPCGGSDVTSEFVDVAIEIKGSNDQPEPSDTDALTFDLGNVPMILSNRVEVDGFEQDMPEGFPRTESTEGQETVFVFRFPRFIDSVFYDPLIGFSQSLIEPPTLAPVTPAPTEAPVILVPASSAPSAPPSQGENKEGPEEEDSNTGAIVGGIVGALGVIGLCCFGAGLYYKRKGRNDSADKDQKHKDVFDDEALLGDEEKGMAGNIVGGSFDDDDDDDEDDSDDDDSDDDSDDSDEGSDDDDDDEEETDDDDEEESGEDESDEDDEEESSSEEEGDGDDEEFNDEDDSEEESSTDDED